MAFYKKIFKPTVDFLEQSQEFLRYMRKNFTAIPLDETYDPKTEMFYISAEKNLNLFSNYSKVYTPLYYAGYIKTLPSLTNDYFILVNIHEKVPQPTVSKDHITMPTLESLLLLAPTDFFTFIKLIATSKPAVGTGDALQLNFAVSGIENFEASMMSIFFTKLITNYRLNIEISSRLWVEKSAFAFLAELSPTLENQAIALQYLAALTYPDTAYFPINTMIELGLDWEQSTSDYAVIPDPTNETKPKLRIYKDNLG